MRRIMCLGLGAAGIAAALFIVCVAGVALAPAAVTAVWGVVLGIPLSTLSRNLSWDRYVAGFVVLTGGTALLVAGVAWLCDRFLFQGPRPLTTARMAAAAHRYRT